MKFNFSPLKKAQQQQKYGNWVDIQETLVDSIFVAWFTHFDKAEAPYIRPMVDAFENDTFEEGLSNEWKTIGFFNRVIQGTAIQQSRTN